MSNEICEKKQGKFGDFGDLKFSIPGMDSEAILTPQQALPNGAVAGYQTSFTSRNRYNCSSSRIFFYRQAITVSCLEDNKE